MKVLVTGANGLLGRELCSGLEQSGSEVLRSVRISTTPCEIPVGEINDTTNWNCVLDTNVDSVVHLAAKVPVSDRGCEALDAQYYQINTLGTANLARQCAEKGIKRFVFISTVKVLGEGCNQLYRADDPAEPTDAYAISKWEAEQSLKQIAAETGMEVVILRPPLVYGPGVKGNFLRLLQTVERRTPLPFGAIQNRRSLIYLGNLVDVIRLCLTHPSAAGKIFMVSDGDDISTPELIRRMATALGHRAFLFPVPATWMKCVANMLGRKSAVDRLVGSLAVDIGPIQADLGWSPPYSMQLGLASTVAWYRKHESGM